MKKNSIRILLVIIIFITLACLGAGSGGKTQDTPEDAIRGMLVEASQGDERGVLSYTVDGVNTESDWPHQLVLYCTGILVEKDRYQKENYWIEYEGDETAYVGPKGMLFITVKRDGKWYVMAPTMPTFGSLCPP